MTTNKQKKRDRVRQKLQKREPSQLTKLKRALDAIESYEEAASDDRSSK